MRVVIDSNILIEDFLMKSNTFKVFLGQLEHTGHSLIMPQIVFDEVINKYRESLHSSKNSIESALKKIRSLSEQDFGNPIDDSTIENLVRGYSQSIRDKLISIHTTFADYPNITHQVVVDRALKRRKPFDAEGQKGYRDTLIWETILQLARNERTAIAIVSKNKKDFGDRDLFLHRDLQDDLENLGEDHCTVNYFQDLESFIEAQIQPLLTEFGNIANQLLAGEYEGLNLHDFLFREITDYTGTDFLEPRDLAIGFGIENPTLYNIEDIHSINQIDVRSLHNNTLLITFSVNVDAVFDFFIYKSDLYGLDEERENIEVWDSDWNDYYAWAIKEIDNVILKISLIFDENIKQVTSAELLEVKTNER